MSPCFCVYVCVILCVAVRWCASHMCETSQRVIVCPTVYMCLQPHG